MRSSWCNSGKLMKVSFGTCWCGVAIRLFAKLLFSCHVSCKMQISRAQTRKCYYCTRECSKVSALKEEIHWELSRNTEVPPLVTVVHSTFIVWTHFGPWSWVRLAIAVAIDETSPWHWRYLLEIAALWQGLLNCICAWVLLVQAAQLACAFCLLLSYKLCLWSDLLEGLISHCLCLLMCYLFQEVAVFFFMSCKSHTGCLSRTEHLVHQASWDL